jgi:hypothetical protein
MSNKRLRKVIKCCVGGFPIQLVQRPVLQVKVNGRQIPALINIWCTCSIFDMLVIETSRLNNQSHGDTVSSKKITGAIVEASDLKVVMDCLVTIMLPSSGCYKAFDGVWIEHDSLIELGPVVLRTVATNEHKFMIEDKDFREACEGGLSVGSGMVYVRNQP